MREFVTPDHISPAQFKARRKALKLTQKELSELIGVSKPTIERWETSDTDIKGPAALLLKMLTPEYVESIRVTPKTMPIRLWYMHKDDVCTLIDVDEAKRQVRIKNFTDNRQFTAFGANEEPSFDDYEDFLRSRCFPENRDKMKLILKDLNLPFYDPFMIIEKTQGRMAEDDFWIEVEK